MTRLPVTPGLLDLNALLRTTTQQESVPPVTEEEKKTLLQSGIGAVQYAAETLDKPGAAVRGLLSGQPEQLWHAVPFSGTFASMFPGVAQAWGMPSAEDRVYGREMLETWGLLDPNREGFSPRQDPEDALGDVAGFAAEVLTDPLMFVAGPGKALTKKGVEAFAGSTVPDTLKKAVQHVAKVAEKPGAVGHIPGDTPVAMAEEIRQGYRGLIGLGLPWPLNTLTGIKHTKTLGAGSEKVAKAFEKLHYGGGRVANAVSAPIRSLRGTFSPSARGTFAGMQQQVADAAWTASKNLTGAVQDVAPVFGRRMGELRKFWDENIKELGVELGDDLRSNDIDEIATYLTEKFTSEQWRTGQVAKAMDAMMKMPAGPAKNMAHPMTNEMFIRDFHDVLQSFVETKDFLYQHVQKLGAHYQDLADTFASHFPRQSSKGATNAALKRNQQKLLSTAFPFALQRVIRDVPDGTLTLNRASRDWVLRGLELNGKGDVVRVGTKRHKADLLEWFEDHNMPKDPDMTSMAELKEEYLWHNHIKPALERNKITDDLIWRRMRDTVKSVDDVPNPLGGDRLLFKAGEETPSKVREIVEWLDTMPRSTAIDGVFDKETIENWFDYMKHLSRAYGSYATMHNFLRGVAKTEPGDGLVPLKSVLNEAVDTKVGRRTRSLISTDGQRTFAEEWGIRNGQWTKEGLAKLKPEDRLKALDKVVDGLYVPAGTGDVLRAHVEATRPEVTNMLTDGIDKFTNLWKWGVTIPFPSFHVRNLTAGLWQNWAHGGMPLSSLLKELFAAGKELRPGGPGKKALKYWDETQNGRLLDIGGGRAEFIERMAKEAPEAKTTKNQKWLSRTFGKAQKAAIKAKETTVAAGDKIYETVELVNRYAPYKILRDQGMSPSQAASRVRMLQFSYGEMSPFVRKFGRRLIPFIQWSSKNIPFQIKGLINEPGGRAAQTIRALANVTRESGEYVPAWLRETSAVAVAGEGSETTYLYGLGLPFEDLNRFRFADKTVPSIGKTTRQFASQMHPLPVYALEQAMGEQLWSGRRLKDVRDFPIPDSAQPVPNRLLNSILAKIPTSRLVTTVGKVMDTRKPWELILADVMTGVKFGTYDAIRWEQLDSQRALKEWAEAHPDVREYMGYYIPQYKKPDADPQAVRALQLIGKTQRRLRELDRQVQ
jgi:hypothetical protein